jgi:hypothetical protein
MMKFRVCSVKEAFFPENSFVQMGKDLIIGNYFNKKLNFVLLFPLCESAVIQFFLNFYFLLNFIDTLNEKRLH